MVLQQVGSCTCNYGYALLLHIVTSAMRSEFSLIFHSLPLPFPLPSSLYLFRFDGVFIFITAIDSPMSLMATSLDAGDRVICLLSNSSKILEMLSHMA